MITDLIDGQTDLLDLLVPEPAAPSEPETPRPEVGNTLDQWARGLGIKLRPNKSNDPRSAYPDKPGPNAEGRNRPDPDGFLTPHFSGYPIPSGSNRTVAGILEFYTPEYLDADENNGEPISGDQTARWARFQNEHRWLCIPRYRDIWPVLYGAEPPATRASEGHDERCDFDHPTAP